MGDPLPALRAIAREARRRVLARAARLRRGEQWRLLDLARRELARAEPLLARTLKDAQLLAWLTAGKDQVRALALKPVEVSAEPVSAYGIKAEAIDRSREGVFQIRGESPIGFPGPSAAAVRQFPEMGGTRPPLPPRLFPEHADDAEPVVRLPQVERAARYLATRLDYAPGEFRALDAEARAVAFTVARAQTLDAVGRVRTALVADVQHGGTLREFRATVREAIDGSALSDSQVEAVYRTHVARAYSAGQIAVLGHPLVADEFPYVLYDYTHDSRARPEHVWLGTHGLDGTGVRRRDDPFWKKWYPPCGWNCRCFAVPLSRADAARLGVREAAEWARTGEPPDVPQWCERPPFAPPKGWAPVGGLLAAAV